MATNDAKKLILIKTSIDTWNSKTNLYRMTLNLNRMYYLHLLLTHRIKSFIMGGHCIALSFLLSSFHPFLLLLKKNPCLVLITIRRRTKICRISFHNYTHSRTLLLRSLDYCHQLPTCKRPVLDNWQTQIAKKAKNQWYYYTVVINDSEVSPQSQSKEKSVPDYKSEATQPGALHILTQIRPAKTKMIKLVGTRTAAQTPLWMINNSISKWTWVWITI